MGKKHLPSGLLPSYQLVNQNLPVITNLLNATLEKQFKCGRQTGTDRGASLRVLKP